MKRAFRLLLRVALIGLAVLILVLAGLFSGALWNRLVAFPRADEEWARVRESWQEVGLKSPWKDFRGVIHVHSAESHDSTVPLQRIFSSAKSVGLDFVALADHCTDGLAKFKAPLLNDGVLVISGFELPGSLIVSGFPSGYQLDCSKPAPGNLAEFEAGSNATVVLGHPEQNPDWTGAGAHGIEIWNLHADADESPFKLAPNVLLGAGSSPDHVMRLIFDRPTDLLMRWDRMGKTHRLAAVAANDAHENQGVILKRYPDRLELVSTSNRPLGEARLGGLSNWILDVVGFRGNSSGQVFRLDADPYDVSLRAVSTHVLASAHTEAAILEGVRAGRTFVSFDVLADATGFLFFFDPAPGTRPPEAASKRVWMGEEHRSSPGFSATALSPIFSRLSLLRDGQLVSSDTGYQANWSLTQPGVYRVEVELEIDGEWVPWIYSSPIYWRKD